MSNNVKTDHTTWIQSGDKASRKEQEGTQGMTTHLFSHSLSLLLVATNRDFAGQSPIGEE